MADDGLLAHVREISQHVKTGIRIEPISVTIQQAAYKLIFNNLLSDVKHVIFNVSIKITLVYPLSLNNAPK